jgi:UDP-4-amino-4,6-dideoxy-N-acetyl-beta-L-altrosamine transaminase
MIPYGKQSINDADINAVVNILKGDWLTTGPAVEKFESDLQQFTGGVPVVSVSSGTAALHCAYIAAGIKPGDEVITPPITFVATQATAVFCGAKIVFCDVQADTGNIDPNLIEDKITPRTKAIVAVDYAGHPAELDEIRKICNKHKLLFIEDASHALGSKYKEQYVGSIADITTFSFFPTKNITTGEGGAIACKDPQMLQKARRFARQGLVREKNDFRIKSEGPWHQEVQEFGLNYRLPDVLAALGISQLHRLNEFKTKRNAIRDFYNKELANLPYLTLPVQKDYTEPFWHLYALRIDKSLRLRFYEFLKSKEISIQVNYLPVNMQPVFQNSKKINEFPNSLNFYNSEISLPIFYDLDNESLKKIVGQIKQFIEIIDNE